MVRSSRNLTKKVAVGIDQSQRGFGLCAIGMDCQRILSTTLVADKEAYPRQQERFYRLVQEADVFVHQLCKVADVTVSDMVFTRENHSFQQHGNAAGNLEIAGMIDYWLLDEHMVDPGYDYHVVLPNVWMAWAKVKKPKREAAKKRKKGESDEQLAARKASMVFDPDAYIAMYPLLGDTEHELDAAFMAMYGLNAWAKVHAEVAKEREGNQP